MEIPPSLVPAAQSRIVNAPAVVGFGQIQLQPDGLVIIGNGGFRLAKAFFAFSRLLWASA